MRIVVSAAAVSFTALLLGAAAAGVDVVPEAAGDHESYWVIEPHEQVVMGGGEEVRTETVYINKTYWVRHPPPPAAHLDGCDRVPGYIHWWHSNATHRLADPGYAPFMEYGVHYANTSSKVMPDLQKRIDAAGDDAELCITAVLTVSGAPGGLVYAGEDRHGGTNATLHAVAGFLRDRGAVLEDYWDWDYGPAYPPVDPGVRGGPYPGSEYPDLEFSHNSLEFIRHQLKQQISARVSPALADELAARPDVVALDVYGKWVGTPEFMFYNSPTLWPILVDMLESGAEPIPVGVTIWDKDYKKKRRGAFTCPHMCFHEQGAVEKSDRYYGNMLDRHLAWTASFIEDRGGNITTVFKRSMTQSGTIKADATPSLVRDLEKLRILNYIVFDGRGQLGMPTPPMPVDTEVGPIEVKSVGKMGRPEHLDDRARTSTHGPAVPVPEEPRCSSGKVPFERPARGDTVCVYPGTAERLGARGPW